MFGFIKKRFFHRFILVEPYDTLVAVHIYDIKNKKLLSQKSEYFTLESKDSFTDELVEYINNKQEEITRSYVVTLVNSQGQGIIPTCSATKFKSYSIDRRYIYNLCVDNYFTNFVSKIEINWIQKLFSKTGIDLIFSPFVILKDLIEQEEVSKEVLLYIFYYKHTVAVIVKKDKEYIFGDFFHTVSEDENPLYCDYENDDYVDEDAFEIEDEFEDENEIGLDDTKDEQVKEVELIEENKGFAKHLNTSLKEFYSNKMYNSSFIDGVKIFTDDKIDSAIVKYIEEELLLGTDIKYIDIDDAVIKLCQKEVIGV